MAGKPGRSGRKRNIRNIQEFYNRKFDVRSTFLIEKLLEEAEKGNATALVYAFDRRFGKPKQQTDIDLTGGDELGVGLVVELFKILYNKQRELQEGKIEQIEADNDSQSVV